MNRFLSRALTLTSFALFAMVSARLVARDPRFLVVVVAVCLALLVPAWFARRRMRRLLQSGDIARILRSWQRSGRRGAEDADRDLLTPLVSATAYAAYGFIDAARAALARAERRRGQEWEVALEQRLFVEALLDVYEGERSLALSKAAQLEELPLPAVGFWMRRKISLLRRGVGALARAFAHASRAGDERVLRDVASSSPLVHWAMRYARAVFLVDAGRREEARALLAGAPSWPDESAFRAFHDELSAKLA